jgi:CRP/FNR family transcriptional regulator
MYEVVEGRASKQEWMGNAPDMRTRRARRGISRRAAWIAACAASASHRLEPEELPQLEAVVSHWRMVHRGEYLYRSGDKFQNLYTVRSGSLKTVATHAGGHERDRFLPAGRNGRPWRDWRRRV